MNARYLEELKQETDQAIEHFNALYQSNPNKAIALAKEIIQEHFENAEGVMADILNNSTGNFKKLPSESKTRNEIHHINEYLNRWESDNESDNN